MKCPICKTGQTAAGHVTVTLERAGVTLVFNMVPATVCEVRGEQYVDEQTTAKLLKQAKAAAKASV